MYTTRDVYGNPRFIIHFLDLVHEDHPGDHCDKMESARRMANKHGGRKYRGRVFGEGSLNTRPTRWSEIGDWVLDNLKTFKELIDLNNELNDETDD